MRTLISLACLLAFWTENQAITAVFNSYQFFVPGQGPYTEFVVQVDGSTIEYRDQGDGIRTSSVDLTIVIYQGDSIITYKKSQLSSEMTEQGQTADILSVERFFIAPGSYMVEVSLLDLYKEFGTPESLVQECAVAVPSEKVFFSSIQPISAYNPTSQENAFSKSGLDLLPHISHHFGSSMNSAVFYYEIYNTDKVFGENLPFIVEVFISDHRDRVIEDTRRIERKTGKPVLPVIQVSDISKLNSGEYRFTVELRNRFNELMHTQSISFTRTLFTQPVAEQAGRDVVAASFSGQIMNSDSLYEIIQSHLPIANSVERNTIDHQLIVGSLEERQSFLYSFWKNRNPENPAEGYVKYQQEVAKAQAAFGTRIRKGWETDRGRVYLQYGPPNTRVERPHTTDYFPFEIWHYYETGTLHDRRFLFYNPSLSGDYELLHSDVPGEVQNANWKLLARSRTNDTPAMTGQRQFDQRDTRSGDELEELFFSPR